MHTSFVQHTAATSSTSSMSFSSPHALTAKQPGVRLSVKGTATKQLVSSPHVPPVLVHDGNVLDTAPSTPQDFLSQYRSYSYTTALVRDIYKVVGWRLHLERLLRNIHILGRHCTPVYSPFMAWVEQQDLADSAVLDLLDAVISPQAAQALQHLAAAQDGQHQQARAMMTVLLTDPQQQQHLQPSQGVPLSLLVWAKAAPVMQETCARVLVAGDPRPLAQAKHCDWVVARQPLEALKQQAGADEVILSNSRGDLLEGLVSNWYVIADQNQLASSDSSAAAGTAQLVGCEDAGTRESADKAMIDSSTGTREYTGSENDFPSTRSGDHESSSSGTSSNLLLMTTGPGHDALLGVTKQRVLEAAAAIGLKVVQQPSNMQQCGAWREAFISNCLRGIQPVSSVVDSAGKAIWTMPSECGAITRHLQEALQGSQTLTDMSQYLQ